MFNFFFRTTGPIVTKVVKNYSLVKEIQNRSYEGQTPIPRGDNSKRVKIHRKSLKIFFSRTRRPISIKLGTNHPWVKGILNCTNKGPDPLHRGDNHKNVKIWRGH
jgi:hypothetical protein